MEIIESFRDDLAPPFKKYEDTYMDGWTDACNEIMSAIYKAYKKDE